MRSLLMVAALVGLSACVASDAPPVVFANSEWRSTSGTPLSIGEVTALSQSCGPRRVTTPIDPDQPVANPIHDNPAYHPGGEGLANAPPSGIAAPDRPIEPGTTRGSGLAAESVADCLYGKGLVKVR